MNWPQAISNSFIAISMASAAIAFFYFVIKD